MMNLSSFDIQRRIVIFILIISFCSIAAYDYYSNLQIKNLSNKNLEALAVLQALNQLEASLQETLTSPNLGEAQNTLAQAIDKFDTNFSLFINSGIIRQLKVNDSELQQRINGSDSLWSTLQDRLKNLQLRLRMYTEVSAKIVGEDRQGLLIDLGRKMGKPVDDNNLIELRALTDDITYILIFSGDRFSQMLSSTVKHLVAEIDDKIFTLNTVALAFSVLVTIFIALYTNRVHKMLVLSESRYHSLHDNLPIGVFRTTEDGKIISANPALAKIHGFRSTKEIIGKYSSEFYKDISDRGLLIDKMKKNNSIDEFSIKLLRSDGKECWVKIDANATNDNFGNIKFFDGIMEDITQKKQIQEALVNAKQEIEQILRLSPAVIYRCGAGPDYPTHYISDNVLRQFGYKPQEFYSDAFLWTKIIHPEDKDQTIALLDRINSGDTVNHQYRLRHKNGSYIWIYDILTPIVDSKGMVSGIIGSWLDVSDRKKVEIALRRSEETLQSLLMAAPIGIGLTHNRRLSWVSDYMSDMTGYSKKELIGKSARMLYPDKEEFNRVGDIKYKQIHKSGIGYLDTKWVKKDGTLIDIHLRSAALNPEDLSIGVIFSALDITNRITAEKALRDSDERFRAIFETAQDSIFIKDCDSKYVSINPAMERLFQLPASEIEGKHDDSLFSEEEADETRQNDAKVFGGDILNYEATPTIEGQKRIFHIIKVPMRDINGNIVGLFGIARDVTEMRRLQDVATRAERLETAGRIAGQVAHDFNNLLGPLVAYPTFIRDELPDGHIAVQFVDDMEQAAEQMAEINQQLLTLGRRGHYNQEPIQLNKLIAQTLTQLPPHESTISIQTKLEPELNLILGGSAQLSRVIANLVTNALDSLNGSGSIEIVTKNYDIVTCVGKYSNIPVGGYVKLQIKDNGQGIDSDLLPKIFDPFFTTKQADRKRGSGLGLSVVHSVVNDHNGYIDIESQTGIGTSFYIYIPTTKELLTKPSLASVMGGEESILIVDDDTVQRQVCQKILQKLGYLTFSVASGEDALIYLRDNRPDLILLDMMMPGGIDGTETFEKARMLYPDISAIIVSGYSESDRVKEALKSGAKGFVKKPLTLEMLAASIRQILDQK